MSIYGNLLRLTVFLICAVAVMRPASADIVNQATAVGEHGQNTVMSSEAVASVPVSQPRPDAVIMLSAQFETQATTAQRAPGDRVALQLTAQNTGNIPLTEPSLSSLQDLLVYRDGDLNSDGALDVGETWRYVGRYELRQADFDRAEASLGFQTGLSFREIDEIRSRVELDIERSIALALSAEILEIAALQPYRFETLIRLRAVNVGNVSLSQLVLSSDFRALAAKAEIIETTIVEIEGLDASANSRFDGFEEQSILADGPPLGAGETGQVSIRLIVDSNGADLEAELGFVGTAGSLFGRVTEPSNQLRLAFSDMDFDGVPDLSESMSDDRDGDGIGDAVDYDPTGYFYCETSGRILTGGRISVENLNSGLRLDGRGKNQHVEITADGNAGHYQFFILEAGRYRLAYSPPSQGAVSVRREPLTGLGSNPAAVRVMGSGEAGNSGFLAEASAPANPFVLEFDASPGRPILINNNLPFVSCRSPVVSGEISFVERQNVNGVDRIEYHVEAGNKGEETLEGLRIEVDLTSATDAGVFGKHEVKLKHAPGGFGASVNPFFDGRTDLGLITSGGALAPGEKVSLRLIIEPRALADSFVARGVVQGFSPGDRKPHQLAMSAEPVILEVDTESRPITVDIAATNPLVGITDEINVTVRNQQDTGRKRLRLVSKLRGIDKAAWLRVLSARGSVGPGIVDDRLIWPPFDLDGNSVFSTRFVLPPIGRTDRPIAIAAWVEDAVNGDILSNIARRGVGESPDPACRIFSGIVFSDDNRDGIWQPNEAGIGGVDVIVDGMLAFSTKEDGRFTADCDVIEGFGSQIAVDLQGVPEGYVAFGGREIEFNADQILQIALDPLREVLVELRHEDFEDEGVSLRQDALAALSNAIANEIDPESILTIRLVDASSGDFARQRLEFAASLARTALRGRTSSAEIKVRAELSN